MQIIKPPMLFDKAKHCNYDTSIFESSTDSMDFFKYLYVDIYNDYFKLEGDVYKIKRQIPLLPNSKVNQSFTKIKKTDTTRIFIAGESVAEFYAVEILKHTLQQDMPDKNFEIINAGTGSYESYRIKRIVKEILKHQPDYIVIMVGNNDGIFEPLEINYFPYKYKIFRTSYVLNRLSNWFVKRPYLNDEECMSFFQKNVLSIVKSAKNKSKLIFVTLPRSSFYFNIPFEENFPEINHSLSNDEKYKNRRQFLRNLPQKYPWVAIADYDAILNEIVHGDLGYNIFVDNEHYHSNMYRLVSRLISEQVLKKTLKIDADYILNLMKENDFEMQEYFINNYIEDENWYARGNYLKAYYVSEKLYKSDPEKFNYFIDKSFYSNNKLWICTAIHLLISNRKEKQALKYLNLFLSKNPDSYKGYVLKALVYYKLANRKLSEECFDNAKKINPKNNFDLKYLDKFYKEKAI
ncbi:MAG: hypothetical protein PHN29_07205 [Endomicrobiaceae bacterium]|nr:hypothetical protein [Endomicrobiaceae bacterium]